MSPHSTSAKKRPQLTIDISPASDDERLSPKHGWDNLADMRQGTVHCKDMEYGLTPNAWGRRNAFDLAMRLYNQGISQGAAIGLIRKFSKPRLLRTDLETQVRQAYEFALNPPGVNSLARASVADDNDDWLKIDDQDNDDWMEGGLEVWPRPLDYDPKQNNATILRFYLDARPTKLISSNGNLFSLEESGVWKEAPEEKIASEIRATDPTLSLDTSRILAIVRAIHVECFASALPFEWLSEPDDAPAPADMALFRNGVLNVSSGDLLPLDGRMFATGVPDYDYDSEAAAPTWLRFLGEALDSSFHPVIQEFFGYLLVPDVRYEKLLSLMGVRRGGKSTTLRVAEWIVGSSHAASRTIADLGSDFALEGLTDKRLLAIPDASDAEVSRRGTALDRLKAITGGDRISINRKNQRIVTTRLPSRIILASNRHPKFLDDSGALAARELVVLFERSFEGKEDRELSAKLRDELPGIANWALVGLKRLRENGGRFTVGTKGLAAARDLAESQSPALRFARACLKVTGDGDDFAPLDNVFEQYEHWALEESLGARERRNREDFRMDLIAALGASGVAYTRRRWHDPAARGSGVAPRVRGFVGILLKQDTSRPV